VHDLILKRSESPVSALIVECCASISLPKRTVIGTVLKVSDADEAAVGLGGLPTLAALSYHSAPYHTRPQEAVFVQMSVTKQSCRRTGQKPAKLLKGLNWGLSTDKSADEPREPPTQQPT
jgi:hypothetical protein